MEQGINLEVIWSDEHVLEILCRCSNGHFSGEAKIYLDHDGLPELANALNGFPSATSNSRDFELGASRPEFAGGGVRMHFHCVDSLGHAAVDIKLRDESCKAFGENGSVALRIPLHPASVDAFIQRLRAMDKTVGVTAHLQMAE